jgi:hypothetical protein
MAGGLMQLVAYGAQDIYLTGNPQITFFKVVYRRHTNFAVEAIQQTFNGAADLGRRFTCTIARNGDLLHRLYLELDVNSNSNTNDYLGFQLIDYVEVEIGGQVIDKQYGEWMAVWCDLTHTLDQAIMLSEMLEINSNTARLRVPLQFWFCRNPGLALPLIALQYHEVKINVQFTNLTVSALDTQSLADCTVWADYIFLDTDERRRFAQVSHEYLIEQVQYSNALTVNSGEVPQTTQQELRFNHPVKELVWLVDTNNSTSNFTGYIQSSTALLQLNGQDRFKRRTGDYFTKVQRYEHHTGAGRRFTINKLGTTEIDMSLEYIHIYSFALKPEEHQPSGTCNFSRIDNAVLNLEFKAAGYGYNTPANDGNDIPAGTVLKVYAVNYNVLRIMSGMGGLAYSN